MHSIFSGDPTAHEHPAEALTRALMATIVTLAIVTFILILALLAFPRTAYACGGLFCDQANPVNQSAERIIFVDHGDGSTTAVIEIQYQGAAPEFAWVLPLPDIANPDEDIRVSSEQALERLQQATNPLYTLTTTVEGTCKGEGDGRGGGIATGGDSSTSGSGGAGPGGVVVEASGTVGPFDYEFISVLDGTEEPAQAAIDWLDANGYDLMGGAELLRPYLEMEMKLLAIRLTKGNDVGSIRPLWVKYAGGTPSIPIRPTAVAAEDDMGVMVFVGGPQRAIPKNYKLLELNDALIDWFNPGTTYADVVNRAADEASGQGFVTEYADDSDSVADVIMPDWERESWSGYQSESFGSDAEAVERSFEWSGWDGYTDALASVLVLPDDLSADDVLQCPNCYLDGGDARVTFDRQRFVTALYEMVIRPMIDTEELVQSQPSFTRMYTTMSAEDMTDDPVFDFNADLGPVDNQHTAEQFILCSPKVERFEAPFRIELPSGAIVYGTEQGVWPVDLTDDDIPAARRISQAGTSGEPTVIVDNVDTIDQALAVSNEPGQAAADGSSDSASCGCRVVGTAAGPGLAALAWLPVALLWLRRRAR